MMDQPLFSKPIGLYLLLFCLLFIGVGGLHGGIAFILEPGGSLLGMTTAFLGNFPIQNYFLPGLFLLTVMGIVPLLLVVLLWQKRSWGWGQRFQSRTHEHWTWNAVALFGYLLLGWLLFQAVIIGFGAPIQWIVALVALAIVGLCHYPSVRKYYAVP